MPKLNKAWTSVLKSDFIKRQFILPNVISGVKTISIHFEGFFTDKENEDMVATFYPIVYPKLEKFLSDLDVNIFFDDAPSAETNEGYLYHRFWQYFLSHSKKSLEQYFVIDNCEEIKAAFRKLEHHIEYDVMKYDFGCHPPIEHLPQWSLKI